MEATTAPHDSSVGQCSMSQMEVRKQVMHSKWDKRFWELAKFVAEWSKDPNAKIGAVITTR